MYYSYTYSLEHASQLVLKTKQTKKKIQNSPSTISNSINYCQPSKTVNPRNISRTLNCVLKKNNMITE